MVLIDNMINPNGNKLYAYIMMLILNETYVPAAFILAESLKNSGCLADLVIFIDDSISKKVEDVLKKFYDKIIRLEGQDIITFNSVDNIQKYIGTKLNALKLDYKKVAIIDVDSIIFNNSNEIFDYDVPACIYSNSKSKFNSGLILLEPNSKDFDNLIEESKNIPENEPKPLVYLLKSYYKNLYRIDEKYLKSNSGLNSYGIQYNKDKPFVIKNKISLEERSTWEHFKIWYLYFRNMITKYPELKELECLKEPLEISKYFLNDLGRFTVERRHANKKIMKEHVEELYGVTDSNPEYYHLNISKEYDSDDITYLLNEFTIGSFVQYIKNKTNLFDTFLTVDIKNIQQVIKMVESQHILDYILSEYVRVMNNVFVVMFIRDDTEDEFKLTRDLKENLFYKKSFNFPGIVLKNILFNINQNLLYDERVKLLSMYNDYTNYEIILLLYQTKVQNNFTYQKHKIFIFSDSNSKIRLSSIFFNKLTLSRYSDQKIKLIKNDKINRKSLIRLMNFQTIKKWIFNNYSGDQLTNLIIIRYKPLTLLDNNYHSESDIKKLSNRIIDIIKIIFTTSREELKSSYKNEIISMYNPKKYWELEGIKILSNIK